MRGGDDMRCCKSQNRKDKRHGTSGYGEHHNAVVCKKHGVHDGLQLSRERAGSIQKQNLIRALAALVFGCWICVGNLQIENNIGRGKQHSFTDASEHENCRPLLRSEGHVAFVYKADRTARIERVGIENLLILVATRPIEHSYSASS
jgi:hypothetical protein